MKTLTQNQKDFILEYFFKNEEYLGWKNIAINLLENGKSVVSETTKIWKDGIGNFIEINQDLEYIDCLLYSFDLDNFLISDYFKEIQHLYEENRIKECDIIHDEYKLIVKKFKKIWDKFDQIKEL